MPLTLALSLKGEGTKCVKGVSSEIMENSEL